MKCLSALRRIWVMAIGPRFAKFGIAPLNAKLRRLIACDVSSEGDCFFLSVECLGQLGITFPPNTPPLSISHDILILFAHPNFPSSLPNHIPLDSLVEGVIHRVSTKRRFHI